MEKEALENVVADSARMRDEEANREYTVPRAIEDAQWIRRTPDAILAPDAAKRTIVALLAALEASPCYLKAARLNLPSFTILPYDKAGHFAIAVWADVAESHGCRPEKVADARAKFTTWTQRPDCKWPD